MLKDKSILITGGTGSFGQTFVPMTLARYQPRRLVVFSRDEMKQWEMAKQYADNPRVRFFIGDIRDKDRLARALDGIDYVIHAAATKIVPTAEYNPFECVKTNVIGAMNLIDACIDREVQRVVALSTDKASSPANLYGATKLTSDKLFVAGNSYSGAHRTRFGVVRYGNVMGSRGSVIPFFLSIADKGELPITDTRMTRFMITLEQGVELVWHALEDMVGGDYLHRMKTENSDITITAVADGLSSIFATNGMRRIFNNFKTISLTQSMDAFHIAGLAAEMHRDYELGQFSCTLSLIQLLPQFIHVHVVGERVNIHEIDFGTAIKSTVGARDESDGTCPDAIPWTHPKGQTGDMQCAGGAVDCHGILRSAVIRDRLFECWYSRTLGKKIRAQDIHNRLDVGFGNVLTTVGNHRSQILPILFWFWTIQAFSVSTFIQSVLLSEQ